MRVTINSRFGEFMVNDDYYGLEVSNETVTLRVNIDDLSEVGSDPSSWRIESRYSWVDAEEAGEVVGLIRFVGELCALWDAEAEGARDAAAERARVEAERREAARVARAELVAERSDRLLNEFIGERIKIRERGYKSMVFCEVGARQVYGSEPEEWEPKFVWTTDHVRTQDLERIVRLDIKAHGRWMTLWDDGTDDLPAWEQRLAGPAKPTGMMYDGYSHE